MDIEKLLSSDTFKSLSKEKLNLIKKFVEETKGKNIEECFKILLEYREIFNKDNTITSKQKSEIISSILQNLPENTREKLQLILTMANS